MKVIELMTVLDLVIVTTFTVAVRSVRATKTTVDVLNIVIAKIRIETSGVMKMTGIIAGMTTLGIVENGRVQTANVEMIRGNEVETTVKIVQVHGEDINHSLYRFCVIL